MLLENAERTNVLGFFRIEIFLTLMGLDTDLIHTPGGIMPGRGRMYRTPFQNIVNLLAFRL
jgi:hypothetical protein